MRKGPITREIIQAEVLPNGDTVEISCHSCNPSEGFVVNVNTFPNNAVARMSFQKGNIPGYSCTGWRASRRIVVTNGHCVYDKNSRSFHTNIRMDFGHRNGPYVQRAGAVLLVASVWYQEGKSGDGWGFVVLRSNVANRTGWFGTKGYKKE